MKIVIRELREGSNPIRFKISAPLLDEIVKSMDELYAARSEGEVDLDVQKYDELMHVRGSVVAPVSFECARCLAERERTLEVPLHWTLMPKRQIDNPSKEEIELSTDDLDTSFYEGEEVDLAELAREAILLELEAVPRCGPDEACAADDYLSTPEEVSAPKADPRWGPLQEMLAKKKQN